MQEKHDFLVSHVRGVGELLRSEEFLVLLQVFAFFFSELNLTVKNIPFLLVLLFFLSWKVEVTTLGTVEHR